MDDSTSRSRVEAAERWKAVCGFLSSLHLAKIKNLVFLLLDCFLDSSWDDQSNLSLLPKETLNSYFQFPPPLKNYRAIQRCENIAPKYPSLFGSLQSASSRCAYSEWKPEFPCLYVFAGCAHGCERQHCETQ